MDSIQCIKDMRILPKEVSKFDIPLCRMIYMPLARSTLGIDIKRLEAEFTHEYWPEAPVFYISIYNKKEEERSKKDEDTSNWSHHWTSVNVEFDAKLTLNPHLKFLSSCMFFVCDGNHRLKAWMSYILRLYINDQK